MFRKRYRTIHVTSEAKARMMTMLFYISFDFSSFWNRSDRVVAFIVKVRVVENKANRNVGIVIVVNVISQTNVPGIALAARSR